MSKYSKTKFQEVQLIAKEQIKRCLFIVRAGNDIIKADFMHSKRSNVLTETKIGIHLEELK